jgi:hypothetical protein
MILRTATCLAVVILACMNNFSFAADGKEIAAKITAAKSGETVQLPAGPIDVGDVVVPSGVSVVGAGYKQTILNATGFGDGLIVRDGHDVRIADLTIKGARGSALSVRKGSNIRIERVRLLDSATGLLLNDATDARAENVIAANNRVGVVVARGVKCAIVNCTIADNASLALSLTGDRDCAVFNNLIVNSQTGVYCTRDNANVAIDHNVYVTQFTGKIAGEATRRSVDAWRDLSGQDRHSVSMTVDFADVKAGDYRPTSPLAWSPSRATSSDWGVKELNGVQAPEKDIDGAARAGDVDAGAFEVSFPKSRPASGTFTVPSSDGVTSAGLYTKDGNNVAMLFQNLPLRAGSYEFWIPSRTFTGDPMPAGEYELRLVQSDLKLEYIAAAGNSGKSNAIQDLASVEPQCVTFDEHDNVVLTQLGFENNQHVRSFDPNFDNNRWVLKGGGNSVGATVSEKGELFDIRLVDDTGKVSLLKMNADTGKGIAVDSTGTNAKFFEGIFSPKLRGMTELNGMLYVADEGKNKVFVTPTSELTFAKSFDVPAPSHAAADVKRNLVWLISGGQKLVAIDATSGAVKHESTPAPSPCALAVNNGKLAVASASQRKIFIFDCSDPANLKPILAIGRGDDVHGPLVPDRFFGAKSLAISSKGEVAVVDDAHVALFSADGKPKRYHMSVWGQHVSHGKFANDDREHFFDIAGKYSFILDAKKRSWEPGTYFNVPENLTGGRSIHGVFPAGGKTYGVYSGRLKDHGMLVIVRFDENAKVTPLIGYAFDEAAKGMTSRTDTNNDGTIDEKDTPTPLKIEQDIINVRPRVHADGSIVTAGNVVSFKGVDGAGIPNYDWAGRRILKYLGNGTDEAFTSPYDFKTKESAATAQDQVVLPDGSVVAIIKLKSGGGAGFNGGGTDAAGFDASGKMRWFHPLNPPGRSLGLVGMQSVAGVNLTARGSENEFDAIDVDGLGLGVLGPTPEFRWDGMWLDHNEQYRAFIGNDGKPYVVTGDYYSQAYHWQALVGYDRIKRSTVPVNVDAGAAGQLAALPAVPYARAPAPGTVNVVVKKLPAPLTIDGDSKKWRAIGFAPQIVVTPETGQGIDGPDDCSAVIRLGYEGKNLYVQVIKFDDVVTMHQPLKFHYKQDSTEMCINGFMAGFKFNITRTREYGDTIFRDRFMFPKLDLVTDTAQVPRVIKVLDDAREIEERKLIEDTYGVDLSKCKVIVTEFKLPLDYAWSPEALPIKVESGASFWLGFFIDDNDTPGLDVQNLLAWPSTFQAYGDPQQGARATFE